MKYSASFKLQVVKFASDNSNNSAASRKFDIDKKLVRDWRRKIDNIKSLPKTKCADRGRKCQWPELEKKVVEWVEENRKSGLAVTRNLIRLHAKKTAQQMNIDNFLVSSGWCARFMKRNKLVLCQKTKISQRLPDDLEEKITSFQSFVIRARRSKNYSLVNIGSMDETPVWFDMPTSKTVDSVGATKYEKRNDQCFIVLKLALELSKYRYRGYLFVFKIYCSNFILEFQIICLFYLTDEN